jgi:anti-sigma factor RsiW
MLYADGELDPERLDEVEAYLARDGGARSKLATMRLAGNFVRDAAKLGPRAGEAADSIADAVMLAIAAGRPSDLSGEVLPAKAEDAGARVIPIDAARRKTEATGPRTSQAPPNSRATRTSARFVMRLAAAAMAVAAGMMLWARLEPDAPSARAPVSAPESPASSPVSGLRDEPAAPPASDGAPEMGVEVAAVDFGSQTGAIFYVPAGAALDGPTTTVVWINDPTGEQ